MFRHTPPAVVHDRTAVTVYATAARVFDAAVSTAVRVAPIKHTDTAGGLVVLETAHLDRADATRYADCGRMGGTPIVADAADVSIVVRDAGGFAAVLATATYRVSRSRNPSPPRCESTGLLESGIETAIKQHAEAR